MGIAALIMAGSVFLSRLMGLVRDKVVSWQFGAGAESDVYFAAFVIPDFLNHLLAGGYISITLIPLLSKRFEEDEADGWRFFSAVFWWATLSIAVLTAVAWIFAPELSQLVGPGFSPEKQARLSHFLRIILPAQVFFLPGACVSALLYIRKQFLTPALTPLIYNGCIIAGGLLVTGRDMEGFCWGVLFGAALGSFLLPVMAARSSGAPLPEGIPAGLRLRFNLRHPLLKRLLLLALPLMLGVSIVAMDEQFVRIFGSMAGEGAVSLLSYARRIMLVPVGVVAQAAGVASFPFLAALAAKGDDAGFDKTLGTALRGSMLVVIPLTAYMMAVALPTLGFIFEGGQFSAEETILAAPLLQMLLLSVPFWVVQQVIGKGFLRPPEYPHPGHRRHRSDHCGPARLSHRGKALGGVRRCHADDALPLRLHPCPVVVLDPQARQGRVRRHGAPAHQGLPAGPARHAAGLFRGLRAFRPPAPLVPLPVRLSARSHAPRRHMRHRRGRSSPSPIFCSPSCSCPKHCR